MLFECLQEKKGLIEHHTDVFNPIICKIATLKTITKAFTWIVFVTSLLVPIFYLLKLGIFAKSFFVIFFITYIIKYYFESKLRNTFCVKNYKKILDDKIRESLKFNNKYNDEREIMGYLLQGFCNDYTFRRALCLNNEIGSELNDYIIDKYTDLLSVEFLVKISRHYKDMKIIAEHFQNEFEDPDKFWTLKELLLLTEWYKRWSWIVRCANEEHLNDYLWLDDISTPTDGWLSKQKIMPDEQAKWFVKNILWQTAEDVLNKGKEKKRAYDLKNSI